MHEVQRAARYGEDRGSGDEERYEGIEGRVRQMRHQDV